MDDETLKVDQLNILALAVPTTEEISLLRGYPGDKAQLATVEQYFLQVMPIPRLGARIAALVFKARAESNLRKVTEEYGSCSAALELKGERALRHRAGGHPRRREPFERRDVPRSGARVPARDVTSADGRQGGGPQDFLAALRGEGAQEERARG